jgi:hypothetical protein
VCAVRTCYIVCCVHDVFIMFVLYETGSASLSITRFRAYLPITACAYVVVSRAALLWARAHTRLDYSRVFKSNVTVYSICGIVVYDIINAIFSRRNDIFETAHVEN